MEMFYHFAIFLLLMLIFLLAKYQHLWLLARILWQLASKYNRYDVYLKKILGIENSLRTFRGAVALLAVVIDRQKCS